MGSPDEDVKLARVRSPSRDGRVKKCHCELMMISALVEALVFSRPWRSEMAAPT